MTSSIWLRTLLAWGGFAGLALAGALVLLWGGGAHGNAPPAQQKSALILSLMLGTGSLLWLVVDRRLAHWLAAPSHRRASLAALMGLALVLRCMAASGWPLLEDDHFRYLWDGLRTVTALDPYRLAPSAYFGLGDLDTRWQAVLSGINFPDVPTVYGPVLQGLFALAHQLLPGHLGSIQALLVIIDMGVLMVLACMDVDRRWLAAYAVHPLVLREAMTQAHPDGLMAFWLLLALVAWQRGAAPSASRITCNHVAWGVGGLLGLAMGTKIAAVVAVPFLMWRGSADGSVWRPKVDGAWAWRVALGAIATTVALYVPFWLAGGSDIVALQAFAQSWRFNPLMFRLLAVATTDPMARMVGTAISAVGLALGVRWWIKRQRGAGASTIQGTHAALPPWPAVHLALAWILIWSPTVNAWYWLWALPLATVARSTAVHAAALTSGLAYISMNTAGVVPWPVTLIQLVAVAVGLVIDQRAALTGEARPATHADRLANPDRVTPSTC